MNFLTKIENFINNLLIRFGEQALRSLKKIIPTTAIKLCRWTINTFVHSIKNFKALPATIKIRIIDFLKKTKSKLSSIDYKSRARASYQNALTFYQNQSTKGSGKLKKMIMAPALVFAKWLQGLSAAQSVLLLALTAGSFLSGISIISSGQRMLAQKGPALRAPASVEDEFHYERPNYYKKDQRHVLVTSVRLPVYIAGINELRSVDIDFNITLTNRQAKKILERNEFQVRDYLILHVEPMIASFPLEEEGREILRQKIWTEIDSFLKERMINGKVEEIQITYVLAN